MDEIVSLVIGTAGHIDHGKSSLVRRLTGVDPDRLKEEKERELTIDLGFAPYRLPDGRTVGIIDVPGHERFVKNMVAGATGIDLVVLVVAADDGVMPQTREHLEILTLLGLEHGLVAVTKTDLPGVDEDLLSILEMELEDTLAGTFLAGAPIVRVSSATGEGFDELERRIAAALGALRPRPESGAFRMPVQRVFSARGFGTVLTGVPLDGSLRPGDTVEVLTATAAHKGRVRGLQAYGRKVERVRAGHSSAVNLADVDWKTVQRGDTVAAPGIYAAASMYEVRLTHLASQERPLRPRETVRFHLGTSEVLGELILLDRRELLPGESGLCQVRLRAPLVAAAGDRFVVRRHSPMETVGGGTVLGTSRWRLKPFKDFVLERLGAREQVLGDAREALVLELDQAAAPLRADALVKALKRPPADVAALLEALTGEGEVIEVSGGKGQPVYVSADGFAAAKGRVTAALAAHHDQRPYRDAASRLELRSALGLPDGLLTCCLTSLEAEGEVRAQAPGFALASHAVPDTEPARAFASGLLALYHERAFNTPTWPQALEALAAEPAPRPAAAHAAQAGADAAGAATAADDEEEPPLEPLAKEDLYRNLLDRGELVAVGDDVVFHRERYEEARERLRKEITGKGPLAAATFKDLLGSSRRYTIPLLEHFDEIGLTRREGDVRVLREG